MGTYLLMMALSFDMFAGLMLAETNWDCIYRKRWRIELGQKKYIVSSLVARKINTCTLTHYLGYGTHIVWPLCRPVQEKKISSDINREDCFRQKITWNLRFRGLFFQIFDFSPPKDKKTVQNGDFVFFWDFSDVKNAFLVVFKQNRARKWEI